MQPSKQEQPANKEELQEKAKPENFKKDFEFVLADIKQKLNNIYKRKNVFEMHNKIAEFGYKLMDKYPDCQKYILFHVLIGSTPPPSAVSKDDFPGEDSIIKFVENLGGIF